MITDAPAELDPIVGALLANIDGTTKYHENCISRYALAKEIIAEVGAHFPRTLGEFFTVYHVADGYLTPPSGNFRLMFQAKDDLCEEDRATAFGTIIKVAGSLMRAGFVVEPTPEIKAMSTSKALDVSVSGKRGGVSLSINFTNLPESERCKLVEEQVLVPERYETKLSVVCDGAPVQLAPNAPKLAETTAALVPEIL